MESIKETKEQEPIKRIDSVESQKKTLLAAAKAILVLFPVQKQDRAQELKLG